MVIEDYYKAKENFKLCLNEDPEDYQVLFKVFFVWRLARH